MALKKKKAVQDLFSKKTQSLFCLCLNSDHYVNKRYLNTPSYEETTILFFCLIVPPVFKANNWDMAFEWQSQGINLPEKKQQEENRAEREVFYFDTDLNKNSALHKWFPC